MESTNNLMTLKQKKTILVLYSLFVSLKTHIANLKTREGSMDIIQQHMSKKDKLIKQKKACDERNEQFISDCESLRQRIVLEIFGPTDSESTLHIVRSCLKFIFYPRSKCKIEIILNVTNMNCDICVNNIHLCVFHQSDDLLDPKIISQKNTIYQNWNPYIIVPFINAKLTGIFLTMNRFQFVDTVIQLSEQYKSIFYERSNINDALISINRQIEMEPLKKVGCPNVQIYKIINMKFSELVFYFSRIASRDVPNSIFSEFMRYMYSIKGGDIYFNMPERKKAYLYLKDLERCVF